MSLPSCETTSVEEDFSRYLVMNAEHDEDISNWK